jgi:hypothetical protein
MTNIGEDLLPTAVAQPFRYHPVGLKEKTHRQSTLPERRLIIWSSSN